MPGILCEHCTAVCCHYVALPLDTPETPSDFEDIRWYLLHEGISVFVEDGDWYICFAARCREVQPDSRCGIYGTRPRVCRAYSEDECDYHSGDYGWDHHFTCPEHLAEYVVARFSKDQTKDSRGKSAARARSANGRKGGKRSKSYNSRNVAHASETASVYKRAAGGNAAGQARRLKPKESARGNRAGSKGAGPAARGVKPRTRRGGPGSGGKTAKGK
jgi:uncharacterized protein